MTGADRLLAGAVAGEGHGVSVARGKGAATCFACGSSSAGFPTPAHNADRFRRRELKCRISVRRFVTAHE
jgi:hypothetical protein